MCTERPKPRLDYWGGKCSEPQSGTEHATSTSRQNWVQIQYLNASRLKTGGARQRLGHSLVDNYDLTHLLNTSASYR